MQTAHVMINNAGAGRSIIRRYNVTPAELLVLVEIHDPTKESNFTNVISDVQKGPDVQHSAGQELARLRTLFTGKNPADVVARLFRSPRDIPLTFEEIGVDFEGGLPAPVTRHDVDDAAEIPPGPQAPQFLAPDNEKTDPSVLEVDPNPEPPFEAELDPGAGDFGTGPSEEVATEAPPLPPGDLNFEIETPAKGRKGKQAREAAQE